jgi:LPXTG-motif cell wall-anchored protein
MEHMVKRSLSMAVVVALAGLFLLAAPASAQYQPDDEQVLDETLVRPGDPVNVSGRGCPPGYTVTTSFDGEVVATTTADGNGAYATEFAVPSGASPGTHTITTRCGDVVFTSTVTVPGAVSGTLPRTGSDSTVPVVQIGLVLLAAGGLATLVARQRRAKAQAA